MIVRGGLELILGSSVDPQFGPVLLFGVLPLARRTAHDRLVGVCFSDYDRERRCTVITSEFGRLKGLRIVLGRELECKDHYRARGKLTPAHLKVHAHHTLH